MTIFPLFISGVTIASSLLGVLQCIATRLSAVALKVNNFKELQQMPQSLTQVNNNN